MHIPKKLTIHALLFLSFLELFYKASEFVEFFKTLGPLEHQSMIEWGMRLVFLVSAIWFGQKAFVILRDDFGY